MNKKDLSERDICTKFITPAVKDAGWDVLTQIREQVYFTKGRIIVRGKLVTRGYNLDFKNPNTVADEHDDPAELLKKLDDAEGQAAKLREQLKTILAEALLQ